MFHLLLHTVDPALGRLDYDSLSDQALMEMLITSVLAESKQYFKDENGNFLDVCEWRYTDDEDDFHGITCKDGRVAQVDLSYLKFEKKQFPFHFIPPLVHFCDIANSRLHGTLDTTLLPLHLTFLILCQNLLHGTINWSGFPRELEEIDLGHNEFCGSCLLQDLPDGMKFLDARNNKLSGELSLDSIPEGMEKLWLGENELSGSIRLKRLPSPMTILHLSDNAFFGDVQLPTMPEGMELLGLIRNKLSGAFVMPGTGGKVPLGLYCECITKVFDETGRRHKMEKELKELSQRCAEQSDW